MLFDKNEKTIRIAFDWEDIIRWLNKKTSNNHQKYENKDTEYHEKVFIEYAFEGWIDIIYTVYTVKNGHRKAKESRKRIDESHVPHSIKQKLIDGIHDITKEVNSLQVKEQ